MIYGENGKDDEQKGSQTINELNDGKYFGEVGLLTHLKRTCTVFSVNNCFCGTISKDKFADLISSNIDLKHSLL